MVDLNKNPVEASEQEQILVLLEQPNKRPFSDGWVWIRASLAMMKQRLGIWILISLIAFACSMAASMAGGIAVGVVAGTIYLLIPSTVVNVIMLLIGNIFIYGIGFILNAGIVMAIASWVEEGRLAVSDVFSGFQYKFKELSVAFLLLYAMFMVPLSIIGMSIQDMGNLASDDTGRVAQNLMMLVVLCVYGFASWFILPLITLHDIAPWQAIKMSCKSSLKNLPAIICMTLVLLAIGGGLVAVVVCTVYGIASLIGMQSSSIGIYVFIALLIIMIPIIFLSIIFYNAISYYAYRNVWTNLPVR